MNVKPITERKGNALATAATAAAARAGADALTSIALIELAASKITRSLPADTHANGMKIESHMQYLHLTAKLPVST